MSSTQLVRNGITLLDEPGKFTLKYGDKKLGTAIEQNGVFVLNFVPELTTADSENILSFGPWEHRDDIDYTDDTVPRDGFVPTSSTTAAAVMLTFDNQGLNDVQNSRDYLAHVGGWGDTTNMPTGEGTWGAQEPDETTWGETPADRDQRLLTEAEQRVADMEVLDSGRLVGIEPKAAASDQESGELVLSPGKYVDVDIKVPPPNLTKFLPPVTDHVHVDGHRLLLSFFANAEYYMRAQGHKATADTWHKRLGHPSQSTLNNTIKAPVLDKNCLLLPGGLEMKPVKRPSLCLICPAANLPHEPYPTHFPGAEDYRLMEKVYSDILNLPAEGFNDEKYVITFTEASTRYVWTGRRRPREASFVILPRPAAAASAAGPAGSADGGACWSWLHHGHGVGLQMRVYHQFTLPFPPSPPPPHLAITGSTLLPTQASSDLASQTIRNKNQRTAMSHPALVLLGLVVTGALVLSVRHAALVIASHGGQSSTSGQSEGEANSGTGGAAGGTSSGAGLNVAGGGVGASRCCGVQVRKYEAVVPRVALVALAVVLAGAVAAGVRH
ncbi:unnamed protein product [Closterium sp. NIES-54]